MSKNIFRWEYISAGGVFVFLLPLFLLLVPIFTLAAATEATAEPRVITAAVLNDFPPLYTHDEAGQPAGFAIDILEHVAKQTGLTVHYLPHENWAKAMQAVRNGEADLIPGIGISPVRSAEFLFTEKMETIPVSCFVRAGNHNIKGIESLPGHRVAVIGQSAAETRLKPMQGVELVPFPNIDSALFQLMAGDVDAFVFPEPVLKKKIRLLNLDDHHIKVVGKPLMELKRGFLLRKSDGQLAERLNPAIKAYTRSKQYLADYQKWYGQPEPIWTVQRIFLGMSLVLIVLLMGLIGWRYYSVKRLNQRLLESRDQLQREQALLHSLIDSIPDLIFFKDHESVYLGCNKAFEEFTGRKESEIVGITDHELFDPELGEFFREKDRHMLASGAARRNEEWVDYPDGRRVLLDTLKTPYYGPGGEVLGLIGISRDITAKNDIEEKLRKRDANFSRAQQLARIGSWELDLVSNKLEWSDEIFRIFEIDKGKFGATYEAFLDAIHPEDRERVNKAYTDSLMEKAPYEITHRLQMKDDSIKYVHEMCESYFDDDGNPIRSVGTVQDITERKRTEEALLESEMRFRAIFESASVGMVVVIDHEGTITEWNRGAERSFGYSAREAVGKPLTLLMPERYRKAHTQGFARALAHGGLLHDGVTYEVAGLRNNGEEFPLELTLGSWKRGGKLYFSAIILDITKRKQAEEALRRTQKMDAIGQLTGGIAHDFNNILSIIIGNLSFLKRQVASDEKALNRVETVDKAAQRAADLTKQLLGFSRKQGQEMLPTDINQVIVGMDNLIARSVTPEVEVEFHLVDDPWLAEIDPGDFEDALLNLVLNARDAMPQGGKLTIETANKRLDDAFAGLNPTVTPGDYLQLAVSDTGSGMPKEVLDNIFEPFFTTKPQGKGTGLGLSMVYGFVQRSRGNIKAYSEPGVGTTFRLYLPRSLEEGGEIIEVAAEETRPSHGHETILIVDDEPGLLDLAKDYLEEAGYNTYTATNGLEALAILESNKGIDLLFSDVVMPGGMNGYELAEQACEHHSDLKVLITSGFTKKAAGRNGQARFAAHLLSKPYRRDDLIKSIQDVLNGDEQEEQ